MQFSKLLMVVVGLAVTGSTADCIVRTPPSPFSHIPLVYPLRCSL